MGCQFGFFFFLLFFVSYLVLGDGEPVWGSFVLFFVSYVFILIIEEGSGTFLTIFLSSKMQFLLGHIIESM